MVHVGVDMDTSEMERQIYASVDDLYFPVSSYNELEHVQMNVAEILCSQAFNYYETGDLTIFKHYYVIYIIQLLYNFIINLVWFTQCTYLYIFFIKLIWFKI